MWANDCFGRQILTRNLSLCRAGIRKSPWLLSGIIGGVYLAAACRAATISTAGGHIATVTQIYSANSTALGRLAYVPLFAIEGGVDIHDQRTYVAPPEDKIFASAISGAYSEKISSREVDLEQGGWYASSRATFTGTPDVFTVAGIEIPLLKGIIATMDLDVDVKKVIDPDPIVTFAWAEISDPFQFTGWTGDDSLSIRSVLKQGMSFDAGFGQTTAERTIQYTTDIPGYELLYELVIGATNTEDVRQQSVEFTSHPSLGLTDSDVEQAIISAFVQDAGTGVYTLTDDFSVFDGSIVIPADVTDFSVAIHDNARATISDNLPQPIRNGVLVSPVSVSEAGLGTEFGVTLENMINQSGLPEPYISGETPFDEFVAAESGKSLANGRADNIWSSRLLPNGEPGGELVFDFGESQSIDGLAIWNATLKEIEVHVADDPNGPWQQVGDFTLEFKVGTESAYFPDVLEFDEQFAVRYLRIDVNSLYRPDEFSAWFAVVNEVAGRMVPTSNLPGDFNVNGVLDAGDVDLLVLQMRSGGTDISFDVNSDGNVDDADLSAWVHDLKNTYIGDSNLDGEFNSADLIAVFQAGEYEDVIEQNSSWATGDWDGDGDFESGDLVAAFADGGYEQGARGASAVPEPFSALPLLAALIGIAVRRRSKGGRTFCFGSRGK